MEDFVGDYKPISLLTHLNVSATFIQVFGDVKVTICLAENRNGKESVEENLNQVEHLDQVEQVDQVLLNMISAMPFVPPKEIERVFRSVFMPYIGKHSNMIDKFLPYIQDNYIGTGGQEGHIPVQLWSQFEAIYDQEESCCQTQSILLQEGSKEAKDTWTRLHKHSGEEPIWATIGRFGLEEELQAVRWREALLEVSANCAYPFFAEP